MTLLFNMLFCEFHRQLPIHTRFCPIKQVRVICAFAQLHQNIQQSHLVWFACSIHYINILHQDFRVPKKLTIMRNTCKIATMFSISVSYPSDLTPKQSKGFPTVIFFFSAALSCREELLLGWISSSWLKNGKKSNTYDLLELLEILGNIISKFLEFSIILKCQKNLPLKNTNRKLLFLQDNQSALQQRNLDFNTKLSLKPILKRTPKPFCILLVIQEIKKSLEKDPPLSLHLCKPNIDLCLLLW